MQLYRNNTVTIPQGANQINGSLLSEWVKIVQNRSLLHKHSISQPVKNIALRKAVQYMVDLDKPVDRDKIESVVPGDYYREKLEDSYYMDVSTTKMLSGKELSVISDRGNRLMGKFGRQKVDNRSGDRDISVGYKQSGDEIENIDIRYKSLSNNIAVLGQKGFGKSSLTRNIMLQQTNSDRGACYIDTKGDEVERFVGQVSSGRKDDIVVLRPNSGEYNQVGFNIFRTTTSKDSDDYEKEVKRLSSSAVNIIKKGLNDNQIDGEIESIIENIIRRMIKADKNYTPKDLLSILKIVTSSEGSNDFAEGFVKIQDEYDDIIDRDIMVRIANRKETHLNPVSKHIERLLRNRTVRNLIAQEEPDLNIEETVQNGKILLIDLSKIKSSNVLAFVGQALISRIWHATKSKPNDDSQLYSLCIDEIDDIATESFNIEDILSTSANLSLSISIQQPSSLTSNIKNNMHKFQSIITFHPGNNPRDQQEIANLLGDIDSWELSEMKKNTAAISVRSEGSDTTLIKTYPEYPPVRSNEKIQEIIQGSLEKYGSKANDRLLDI